MLYLIGGSLSGGGIVLQIAVVVEPFHVYKVCERGLLLTHRLHRLRLILLKINRTKPNQMNNLQINKVKTLDKIEK